MQPGEPEDLEQVGKFALPTPPLVPEPILPAPVSMDNVQLDMSQLTADDVERAFPQLTQEQEQKLRMAVGAIVLDIQHNFDIGRQAALLIAGAQSVARLIGFALKP